MELLHWLLGETGCIAIASLGLAGGLTVALVPTKLNKRLAKYLFAIGLLWIVPCSVKGFAHVETTMKYVYVFLIGGTISSLWLGSWRWVEANYKQQPAESLSSPSPTPRPSQEHNAPSHHNNQQQQNNSGGINTQQSTTGANSPIISGSNNRVTTIYSNQKLEAPSFQEKLEEVSVTLGSDPTSGTAGGGTFGSPPGFFDKPEAVFKPFSLSGYEPIQIRLRNNTMLFSFRVWAGEGQSPIEIKDNAFTVRHVGWDINSTANALEVVNERNVPVFQMIRRRPGQLVINGIFPLPGGLLMVGWPGGSVFATRTIPSGYSLHPLFMYPSWKYAGKYAEDSTSAPPAVMPQTPMQAHINMAVDGQVTSTDPAFPYAYRVTVQTDKKIEHVAMVVDCSGAPDRIIATSRSGGGRNNYRSGAIEDHPEWPAFEWDYPPFTPDNPIVVIAYGKERLITIKQVRFLDHIPGF